MKNITKYSSLSGSKEAIVIVIVLHRILVLRVKSTPFSYCCFQVNLQKQNYFVHTSVQNFCLFIAFWQVSDIFSECNTYVIKTTMLTKVYFQLQVSKSQRNSHIHILPRERLIRQLNEPNMKCLQQTWQKKWIVVTAKWSICSLA